jgi:tetratricopeptide (TPR) repeat protein
MNHRFILCLFAVFNLVLSYSADFHGQIFQNELGGAPIANVAVSAEGAQPQITDSSGRFDLYFPTRQPGEKIILSLEKDGFLALHSYFTEQILRANLDQERTPILMARGGDREQMAHRFFRLEVDKAVEKNFQESLQRLSKKQLANDANYTRLREDSDQAKLLIEKAGEEFAKQSADTSALLTEAMRLFLSGQLDSALSLLTEERLNARKNEAERSIASVSREFRLRGELLALKFRFDDASRQYAESVAIAPNDFEANFDAGVFFSRLRRNKEALSLLQKALELARQSKNLPDVAITLNELGVLYLSERRMNEARGAFDEAVEINQRLSESKSEASLADLAFTLANQGRYYFMEHRLTDARTVVERAITVYRPLAQQQFTNSLSEMARALQTFSSLNRTQNRVEDARKASEEALKISRELAKDNGESHLSSLAEALNTLGLLQQDELQLTEAQASFDESIVILRGLVEKNPDAFLPELLNDLLDAGVCCGTAGNLKDARKLLDEALDISKRLAGKNPDEFLPQLGKAFDHLGWLCNKEGRYSEAIVHYDEQLKTVRHMAERNPDLYRSWEAHSLLVLGRVHCNRNEASKAKVYFQQAVAIQRGLTAVNPDTYQMSLSDAIANLSSAYSTEGSHREAVKALQEAADLWQRSVETNTDANLVQGAEVYKALAFSQCQIQSYQDATHAFDQSIALWRRIYAKVPQRYAIVLAETLLSAGTVNVKVAMPSKARDMFAEALNVLKGYSEQRSKSVLWLTAGALNNLGLSDSDSQAFEGARRQFNEALVIWRALMVTDPIGIKPELIKTIANLAELDRREGRFDDCRTGLMQVVALNREMVSTNKRYEDRLATALIALGDFCVAKMPSQSRSIFQESVDIWRRLSELQSTNYAPDLASSLERLADAKLFENDLPGAIKDYGEAESIWRMLASGDSPESLRELARFLEKSAKASFNAQSRSKQDILIDEAVGIRRKLAETKRDYLLNDLGNSLDAQASLFESQKRLRDARRIYTESVAVWRDLFNNSSHEYAFNLITSLNRLGDLYFKDRDMNQARKCWEESISIRRQSGDTTSDYLIYCLEKLVAIHLEQHHFDEAQRVADEVLALSRKQAESKGESKMISLANALAIAGFVKGKANADGNAMYEEAFEVMQSVPLHEKSDCLVEKAIGFSELGSLFKERKRFNKARVCYQGALAAYKLLAQQNPSFCRQVKMVERDLDKIKTRQRLE